MRSKTGARRDFNATFRSGVSPTTLLWKSGWIERSKISWSASHR